MSGIVNLSEPPGKAQAHEGITVLRLWRSPRLISGRPHHAIETVHRRIAAGGRDRF